MITYSVDLEDITVSVISSEFISGAVKTENELSVVCDCGPLHVKLLFSIVSSYASSANACWPSVL